MSTETEIRKALASGPTSGVWKCDQYGKVKVGRFTLCDPTSADLLGLMESVERAKTNANYIAACSPANIAELLAELDAAKLDAERYRLACLCSDNAETLYVAVINNQGDQVAINTEFDAFERKAKADAKDKRP